MCQQNTRFNLHTEISERKQGSPCTNSHSKRFSSRTNLICQIPSQRIVLRGYVSEY